MDDRQLNLFRGLAQYQDKLEILNAIIVQLEKDAGFDYTQTPVDADNPEFLDSLRNDLSHYLKKIAGQNQTRFMHIIYRVDITQTKMAGLGMDEHYYFNLAELVLNRMLQKVITKKYYKP